MIDKNDPRLTAYVLGELDSAETETVRIAIQQSPDLQSAVDEIRQTVAGVSQAFQSEVEVGLDATQREDLKEQIVAANQDRTSHAVTKTGGIPRDTNSAKAADVAKISRIRRNTFVSVIALLLIGMSAMFFNPGMFEDVSLDLKGGNNLENTHASEAAPEKMGRFSASDADEDKLGEEITSPQSQPFTPLGEAIDSESFYYGKRVVIEAEEVETYSFRDRPELELTEIEREVQKGMSGKRRLIRRYGGSDSSPEATSELLRRFDGTQSMSAESDSLRGLLLGSAGFDPNSARETADKDTGRNWPATTPSRETERGLSEKFDRDRDVTGQGQLTGKVEGKISETEALKDEESRKVIAQLLKRVDPSGIREIRIASDLGGDKDRIQIEFQGLNGKWEATDEFETRFEKLADKATESWLVKGKSEEQSRRLAGELLEAEVEKRNKEIRKKKTWRRSQATPNASRLMIGDHDELDLQGMQVNVQVEGFRARVLIDCFYYNDRAEQLEGAFKLRLPDDASLYYFAFGESVIDYSQEQKKLADNQNEGGRSLISDEEFLRGGERFVSLQPEAISRLRKDTWENVKEARMVPREKAAHAYSQTVRRRVDPALVEWAGAGVFNARVFPLMPNKQHRIVIGYDVDLKKTENGLTYEVDLPEFAKKCRVDLDVLQTPGATMSSVPDVKPTELESDDQGQHWRYSFKEFETDADSGRQFVRLDISDTGPMVLRSKSDGEGNFFATRITPKLPVVEADSNSHAIFLVDTSLSSQPDKFNVWLKMLKTTLTANRDSLKKFNVMFFNVENHFWKDGYVDNTAANVDELIARCETLALEGATDLFGVIETLKQTEWVGAGETKPDLFLLSDGAANWGETNLRLMIGQFEQLPVGSLFAYQSGLDGTAIANLRFLAGETGGAVFSIASEAEIDAAALAHRNRPWLVETIEVDGGDDVMTAGRVKWIYPGQSLTVVGRVDPSNPDTIGNMQFELSQGAETKTVEVEFNNELKSTLTSGIYGSVAVGQLESLGEEVVDVATAYARHFRVTGSTCSLLMLESEEDYQRFDIKPEEDLFVIKSKAAGAMISKTLETKAKELSDPKAQLTGWLERLESLPGIEFKMPTAMKLAMDDIEVVAISDSLNCDPVLTADLPESYRQMLKLNKPLDYNQIRREAARRTQSGGSGKGSVDEIDAAFADDALKVISNLVERNPGDLVLARDVAFMAMELNRPSQAYHLLRRIVRARPFDPSIYTALGQCLTQLDQPGMAMVYYEVAVNATFPNRQQDYRQIAATEYVHLLKTIVEQEEVSPLKTYASARLQSLTDKLNVKPQDLVVTMMWNTDQTDVDLHILEPSGEECFYQHKNTKSGGKITRDITDGYGPEMYSLSKAPGGEYQVLVNYYANNQNRTDMRSKVYLTIYRKFGSPDATVTRKTIELNKVGGKQRVDVLQLK